MGKGELTSSQVAERLGVAHSTVRVWCNRGIFPNARREETIAGSFWVIPEGDLRDFQAPERGRPPKPKASGADGKVTVKASRKGSKK